MDDCETITDATNRDAVGASRSHDSPLMNKSFSPRPSNRLRHSLSTQAERVLHRTHAGGVAADGSPKLSSRKTIIANTKRSLSAVNNRTSKSIQSKTIEIDSESDDANEEQTSADSSQSTSNQEKEELAANRLRIYYRRPSNSNLLTRAQILEHYEWNSDGFKCKICGENRQASHDSDSNLRKYLARVHQFQNVLFVSQTKNLSSHQYILTPERRRELDDAAIQCIVEDDRAFGDFKRPGMQLCLAKAVPNYYGPH